MKLSKKLLGYTCLIGGACLAALILTADVPGHMQENLCWDGVVWTNCDNGKEELIWDKDSKTWTGPNAVKYCWDEDQGKVVECPPNGDNNDNEP